MRKCVPWGIEEDEYLVDNYATMTSTEIGVVLGRTRSAVKNRCRTLGVKLGEEFKTSDRLKKIKPGTTSWNKGVKMSPEAYEKARPTMFKKGSLPHNHKPVGHTRINVDGYIEIKVAEPNEFKFMQRMILEKLNGPIPDGYLVQFKDKNRLNVDPQNLYLINRQQQMLQNTIHNYPPEIKELIRLTGKLKRNIKKYGEEQNE